MCALLRLIHCLSVLLTIWLSWSWVLLWLFLWVQVFFVFYFECLFPSRLCSGLFYFLLFFFPPCYYPLPVSCLPQFTWVLSLLVHLHVMLMFPCLPCYCVSCLCFRVCVLFYCSISMPVFLLVFLCVSCSVFPCLCHVPSLFIPFLYSLEFSLYSFSLIKLAFSLVLSLICI